MCVKKHREKEMLNAKRRRERDREKESDKWNKTMEGRKMPFAFRTVELRREKGKVREVPLWKHGTLDESA